MLLRPSIGCRALTAVFVASNATRISNARPATDPIQGLPAANSVKVLLRLIAQGEATRSSPHEEADEQSTCCGDAYELPRLRVHVPIALLERVLSASAQHGLGRGHCVLHARTKQTDFRIGHVPQRVDQRLNVGE